MKHLLPMRLAALLVVLLAVGNVGCVSSLVGGDRDTKESRLLVDTEAYNGTMATIIGLRIFGAISDADYPVVDKAREKVWNSLEKRKEAIANDSPDMAGSDYRVAVDAFVAAMAEWVTHKKQAEKVKSALERAKSQPPAVEPVPAPAFEPTPVPQTP